MLRNPVKKLVIDAHLRGDAGRRSKRKKLEREGSAEKEEEMASPELSTYQNSCEKLRLPDKLREPREVKLREAGGGRRLWDVEVVFDGDGNMYLERGWDQFAGAHHLGLGNVLVFSYDGGAVLTAKVFHDADAGSGSSSDGGSNESIDSASNNSSSAEIGIEDAPASQFTVTPKKCHLGMKEQQYLGIVQDVPREFQNAHRGREDVHIWADPGSNNSIVSSSNSSSSAEIGIDDVPTSQFTVTLKKRHSGVRQQQQQQYLNVPPEFQDAHRGHDERSKVLLRMPGKLWPVNLKRNILFVTIAVLFCIVATPTTARAELMMDRWEQIPNVNTTEVQDIARWAVAEHDRQANDGLQLRRVVSGMEQTVQGTLWLLRLEAVNGDGEQCVYIAQASDEQWTNTRILYFFTPAQSTQPLCKPGDHPVPPPNSRAPKITPSFVGISCALFLCTAVMFR